MASGAVVGAYGGAADAGIAGGGAADMLTGAVVGAAIGAGTEVVGAVGARLVSAGVRRVAGVAAKDLRMMFSGSRYSKRGSLMWGEGSPVRAYQVGTFNALQKASVVGDGLDIHHVGQKHVMKQLIPGYNPQTAPAIALPADMHRTIPRFRGVYDGNVRQLFAHDIRNLRRAGIPNRSLKQLMSLNKELYPGAFGR